MGSCLFLIICGLAFLSLSIWGIVKRKNCQIEIEGTFIRHNSHRNWYSPVFQYEYGHECCESQARESISKRYAARFIPGNRYSLYLNGNDPRTIVLSRKVQLSDLLLMGFGMVSFILGFACMP